MLKVHHELVRELRCLDPTGSDPGCLRKGWGIMGFLKNNPKQSSRAYPILSDVSGFPGSKIGDTFDSCNIGHGPLKRCGSSGVHPLALDRGTLWLWTRLGGADKLGSNMRGGKTHRRHTGPMLSSPRCRARTCSGKPCRSAAVRGKRRPDAWRCPRFRRSSRQYYGQYTREALAELQLLRNVFRQSRELLQR